MMPSTIRTLRLAMDLSQEGFARLLGVSKYTVTRWESGHNAPDPRSQRALEKLEKLERKARREACH